MSANAKLIKGGIQYLSGKITGNNVKKIKGMTRILQGKVQAKLKLS